MIVDASVAVKWFVPETDTELAAEVLATNDGTIAIPELFLTEVSGALVSRANMDKSLRPPVEVMIERLLTMWRNGVFAVFPLTTKLCADASRMALDLGHPLKDCVYLALATELRCPLVTADARFADRAREAWGEVTLLGSGCG